MAQQKQKTVDAPNTTILPEGALQPTATEQDKSRPLINSTNTQEVVANLIRERQEYYEKTSNIKINTDNYDTVKISKIIIKDYEKNNS